MADSNTPDTPPLAEVIAPTPPAVVTTTNPDSIVAEIGAPSYAIEHTNFQDSFSDLLELCLNDLVPKIPGVKVEPQAWVRNIKHMKSSLSQIEDNDVFRRMFAKFYSTHRSVLSAPVIVDGAVNDAFFKTVDPPVAPGGAKHAVNGITGPVIFYSDTDPKCAAVCVPIGEAYRAAIKRYLEAPSHAVKKKLLPTAVLLNLFSCFYHSFDEDTEERAEIETNVIELCDTAECIAPGTGPGAADSATAAANPLGDIFSMVSSLMNGKGVPSMAGGKGGEIADVFAKMGGVVKNLFDTVSTGDDGGSGSSDPAAIANKLGQALQNKELQQTFVETALAASTAFAGLTGVASTPPVVADTGDDSDDNTATTTTDVKAIADRVTEMKLD